MTGSEFYETLKHNRHGFPLMMGILNVTPDSFSDGGLHFEKERAIEHGLKLLEDGADLIDVGGESTRPGSSPISTVEEQKRVIPVIDGIKKHKHDTIISIDTSKSETAKAAVSAGAIIINDINGLTTDTGLAEVASEFNLPMILMHIQGTPSSMQVDPHYENVLEDITLHLKNQINLAQSYGVDKVVADVGIGFGKTLEHNIKLLRCFPRFTKLGVPLLLGISRKSFIKMLLNIEDTKDRDIPTVLLHAMLARSGAAIIRVHNVQLHQKLKILYQALYSTPCPD